MNSPKRLRIIIIALMVLPILVSEFLRSVVIRIYDSTASPVTPPSSSLLTFILIGLVLICCVAIALALSRRVFDQLSFLTRTAKDVRQGKAIPHVHSHHVYDEFLPLYQHLKVYSTFHADLTDRVKKLTLSPSEELLECRSDNDEFIEVLNGLFKRLYRAQQVVTAIHDRNLALLETLDEQIIGSDTTSHAMISEFTTLSARANDSTNHIIQIGSQIASLTSQELQDTKAVTKRLSDVSQAVNKMTANIQHIVEHLEDQSFRLSDTSSAIEQSSQSVDNLAQSMAELKDDIENNILHAERTENISSTLDRISETTTTINRDATTSMSVCQEVLEAIGQGQKSVEQNVDGIEHIQESMRDFFAIVKRLGERSEEVSEILEAISDIVDHTNLLAINAAIISVHAGEHGRDFAVIADEIGKFAERTRESTVEIEELLLSFQEEFTQAMQAMERTSDTMSAGIEFAHNAGKTFNTFAANMAELHDSIGRIAKNSLEHGREHKHLNRMIAATEQLLQKKHDQMLQSLWQMMQMIAQIRGTTAEQTERSTRISSMAENVEHLIRDIKQVSKQYMTTSQQVTGAVNRIPKIVQRTARSSEKTIRLSQELFKTGGNLAFTMGEFALSSVVPETTVRAGVPLVGFIRRGNGLFFDDMVVGIREEASKHGFDLLELNSHYEVTTQVENVNWAVKQPMVKGIILCPTDAEVAQKLVQKGMAQGIPFVAADESIPITISVRSGNREGGRRAAKLFMQHLQPNAVVGVLIDRSVESINRRGLGFRQKAEQHPLYVVEMHCNITSHEDARNDIVAAITENPELQGIFLPNEDVTNAYLDALHSGLLPPNHLLAVGYDQTPQVKQAIKNGELLGAIFQHPDEIGKQAFQQLHKLITLKIRVEDLDERTIYIPTIEVTKEQLHTLKQDMER
ncbi:hypothetical protein CSA56_07315 [candidate division KSB3 bacterium]|uniref:Methyl-accepting transducer domain-containing protein n=1 Tax=candidate division KSB3 bacterium TaxID=2044937 RepID=A0A2G6KHV5_9BACT|nr:MAG: hypothetical protein CSA56_07315 [candidate division KSB3 bacterium]